MPHWSIYRPSATGVAHIPLSVRSVGRYEVDKDWHERPKRKWFLQLFWIVRGVAEFRVGDKGLPAHAREIFTYRPGECHHIKAASEKLVYCWITFDHPAATGWLQDFGLQERLHTNRECPEFLFDQIANCLKKCTPKGERESAQAAHALLLEASNQTNASEEGSSADRAMRIILKRFLEPDFDISGLAESLHIHRSTLFRIFTTHHGLNPSRCIQNLRIQRALGLLRNSELQIQEVAWKSGFADPNYFSRAIRGAVGMSPIEFRES